MNILERNIDITSLSNFKTKAIAKYYFEINNESDLIDLLKVIRFSEENFLKVLFIGGGTNMLFAFDVYNGIVIKNNLNGWNYNKDTKILESYSSNSITDIAIILEQDDNQFLWHRFIGLPGSIGGAVFGNAGCFGLEIENNFLQAKVLNLDNGNIEILSKKEMNFSYRNSILKETGKYFLISCKFDLLKKIEKYSSNVDNIKFRNECQPKGNTCGSFFKNPSKDVSAGYLIEKAGFKGYNLGGAYFSSLHSNFLINKDGGNYLDLVSLIDLVKENVKSKYAVELVNEIRIIKN